MANFKIGDEVQYKGDDCYWGCESKIVGTYGKDFLILHEMGFKPFLIDREDGLVLTKYIDYSIIIAGKNELKPIQKNSTINSKVSKKRVGRR